MFLKLKLAYFLYNFMASFSRGSETTRCKQAKDWTWKSDAYFGHISKEIPA